MEVMDIINNHIYRHRPVYCAHCGALMNISFKSLIAKYYDDRGKRSTRFYIRFRCPRKEHWWDHHENWITESYTREL